MGLDKHDKKVFNGVMKRMSQATVSLGRLFKWWQKRAVRVSPLTRQRREFEEEAREEFQKLKDKGLNIPVFTL